jgi:predicted enzyme related to lactoylglutathione lyase
MPPTLANGKICYIEIPAIDVSRSIAFYEAVFRWQIRRLLSMTASVRSVAPG